MNGEQCLMILAASDRMHGRELQEAARLDDARHHHRVRFSPLLAHYYMN